MGQVPLLIIIDVQLERQQVWKNADLPLGAMMGGRKAKRTMPDFLLRDSYLRTGAGSWLPSAGLRAWVEL